MSETLDRLLETRERRGLRFILTFRSVFVLFGLILAFFTPATRWEMLVTIAMFSTFAVCTLSGFYLVRRSSLMSIVGWGGVAIDLVMIAVLPFVWLNSVGGDALVSRAYLVKLNTLTTMSYSIIVMNSVASRPAYPAATTAGAVAYHLFLFYYAGLDSRVVFEENYVGHMLGDRVHPGLLVTNLLVMAGVGACLTFFTHVSRQTLFEAIHREKAALQISRYFSPSVYNHIAQAEDSFFTSSGRLQEVTVLFSDLRGFTTMSEQMSAADVIRFLREYHETMVQIIFKHHGTLDKFIGDAIMATFGTPDTAPDDPNRAVAAALDMRRALAQMNANRESKGLPPLRQGIGIHTGQVIAGNIGTAERLEYTVIGDTVNVASRVESATKEAQTDVLVTQTVADRASADAQFEDAGLFDLKGKSEKIRLFRLL